MTPPIPVSAAFAAIGGTVSASSAVILALENWFDVPFRSRSESIRTVLIFPAFLVKREGPLGFLTPVLLCGQWNCITHKGKYSGEDVDLFFWQGELMHLEVWNILLNLGKCLCTTIYTCVVLYKYTDIYLTFFKTKNLHPHLSQMVF